jgi:transglutaminase-like putative cysteine protease
MLEVRHITRYRYARPVRFGEHRMMLRPREDPDQVLLAEQLRITPEPARLRIERDSLGNFVAFAAFAHAASELCIVSEVVVGRGPEPEPHRPPLPGLLPFHPETPGADLDLAGWARCFASACNGVGLAAMAAMNAHIHRSFTYRRRLEPGVQAPEQTLASGSGACRDFAMLMVAAARILGLKARFASGYVHCQEPGGMDDPPGGGHTHAWAQVLTPEAGWVDFDPTSGRVGPDGLVRVAVADRPQDALPIQGVYLGAADDFLDMQVEVQVRTSAPELSPSWSVA